jgi:hypothetical protein
MHCPVNFLVLCVMIQYQIMVPLSPLSSLIIVSHQNFCSGGMHDTSYEVMILPLWLVLAHWRRKIKEERDGGCRISNAKPYFF